MSKIDPMEYPAMASLFPETDRWIYFETNDNPPVEEIIKSYGKWVIYDSEQRVINLANKLKKEIGKDLRALKYSVEPARVTPNAPDGKYALIVYCHEAKRDNVLTMLKDMGVNKATWKYDRESFIGLLQDPSFCFRLELFNPGEYERLAELLQIEVDYEFLQRVRDLRNYVEEIEKRLKAIVKNQKKDLLTEASERSQS